MDRGAWQAVVHWVAELDMAEVTQHMCMMISDVEHLSIYLVAICTSLEKCLFKSWGARSAAKLCLTLGTVAHQGFSVHGSFEIGYQGFFSSAIELQRLIPHQICDQQIFSPIPQVAFNFFFFAGQKLLSSKESHSDLFITCFVLKASLGLSTILRTGQARTRMSTDSSRPGRVMGSNLGEALLPCRPWRLMPTRSHVLSGHCPLKTAHKFQTSFAKLFSLNL